MNINIFLKKLKKIQNPDEINEDYDNFANFDEYKKEFLLIEKEYIKNGITTVFELGIDKKAFAFWKKMCYTKANKGKSGVSRERN